MLKRARPHVAVLAAAAIAGCGAALAQGPTSDSKPYDDKLMRLSEILGAVHYLRELCGANDGQMWRDRMRELMDTEGSSALRRARLTRSFNKGYYGYSRTYKSCTASARMRTRWHRARSTARSSRVCRARCRMG